MIEAVIYVAWLPKLIDKLQLFVLKSTEYCVLQYKMNTKGLSEQGPARVPLTTLGGTLLARLLTITKNNNNDNDKCF